MYSKSVEVRYTFFFFFAVGLLSVCFLICWHKKEWLRWISLLLYWKLLCVNGVLVVEEKEEDEIHDLLIPGTISIFRQQISNFKLFWISLSFLVIFQYFTVFWQIKNFLLVARNISSFYFVFSFLEFLTDLSLENVSNLVNTLQILRFGRNFGKLFWIHFRKFLKFLNYL